MSNEKNNGGKPVEQDLGEQTRVRREKLAALQAEGRDPFQITRFDWDITSAQIKERFEELEGKPVKVAGRLMSKRGMGKVSFCDLQDRDGRIQLYARQDEMDEAEYKRFKKYDIGDIVGVSGEVFRTQRGEMSVRAKQITLLSKSLLPLPENPASMDAETFTVLDTIIRSLGSYGLNHSCFYLECEDPMLYPTLEQLRFSMKDGMMNFYRMRQLR